MFDALETGLAGPITTIEVQAIARELEISEPFRAGGQEILSSAGVFGDVSRFLQLFPGVVASSDLSNEVMVRGGHPMENLFVVDGIEVPNINHLAVSGTTGGFGPMIDSALIQALNFYTGGYDARYPERLSSVVEIQTLHSRDVSSHVEGDFGIQGAGGIVEKQFDGNDLLGSVHYGLLNLMDNAGITGLPSYINELIRFRRTGASGNRLTILHLGGRDAVEFSLCPEDPFSFSTIVSQYSGWRETTGIEWQSIYSTRSFGVASVSDSEEMEKIHQKTSCLILNILPIMTAHARLQSPTLRPYRYICRTQTKRLAMPAIASSGVGPVLR